jgi:hypothetical protein
LHSLTFETAALLHPKRRRDEMSTFKHLDEYKAIREKWVHEDNVINHRLSWLILSQAMLLAAYGWSITSPEVKTQKLLLILPIFGLIFTLTIGASVFAAVIAQNHLSQLPGVKEWPQPYSVDTFAPINWPGRLAAIFLPIFLFIVWLIVSVA